MLELSIPANVALTVVVSVVMVAVILWLKLLSITGAATSFFMGITIGIFGGFEWLLLLLVLVLSSFVSTKYKFHLKKKMGVQEGKGGERGIVSVLANGGVAIAVAIMTIPFFGILDKGTGAVIFITAISVAGADTLASEIGVLSKNPRLITTFERVSPGTDGGISILGTLAALAASAYITFFGYIFLLHGVVPVEYAIIPLILGFFGCQVDSLIGATFERWGYISKSGNNFLSITWGAICSWVWVMFL